MSENTTTGGLVEELRALRNVVADRHRSASEALAEVRGANKLRIYEYQRGREIAYDFIQGELDDLLDAHASRTAEATCSHTWPCPVHSPASSSPKPGAVGVLARLIAGLVGGRKWVELSYLDFADAVLTAGYLSPADVERAIAAAKAEGAQDVVAAIEAVIGPDEAFPDWSKYPHMRRVEVRRPDLGGVRVTETMVEESAIRAALTAGPERRTEPDEGSSSGARLPRKRYDPDHCTACGDFQPCGNSWIDEAVSADD